MPNPPYHPQAQAVIDMINSGSASAPPLDEQPLDAVRMGYAGWYGMNGPGPEISEVRDVKMLRDDGPPIPARVYRPTEADDAPIVVFFHGGGMVIGSMDVYDGVCRSLADSSGAVVVNVDYRLAPEHASPAQTQDAWDAVRWVGEHASDLGGSEDKLVVCGDSAGGNLAALCALRARDQGTPHVALQMLIYPVVDWAFTFESLDANGTGNFLTKETMMWFRKHYLGDDETLWNAAEISPFYADTEGVCPAWVLTTSHDPLRDEGIAYAEKLRESGVATTHINVEGVFHAFFGQTNVVPELASKALADAAAAIKAV
ncbi:MAG: alpha/beta hydrolase [Acidimicrobiales bacterium]|nr:alpha/beta hydrolase [Acidimicrobiales bacterium]